MKRFYLIICFLMSIIGSAWGQETYSIAFTQVDDENAIVQSTENYFTLSEKQNRKVGTSCTYNGNTYGPGLKMESSTSIKFTTSYVADVTIVQGTNLNGTIKFQDKELPLNSATENTDGGYREYVIKNVASGTEHTISRGSGESTIFFVQVSPSTDNVTSFAVSDFNYTTSISAKNGLNRTAGGFKFEFTSNNNYEFVKVNSSDRFFFRGGQSGTLAISTDDNNSDCNINKVVLHAVTPSDLSSLTGFSVTDADSNDLTYTTDDTAGTIIITSAVGTSKININTSGFSCAGDNGHLYINKIDVYTDKQVTSEKVTPQLAFASTDITTTVGGGVSNALTTTPNNFAVTYTSSNDAVATVDEKTGTVTIEGEGQTTITANFVGNNYYNAASSYYTLSVIEPKTTLNIVDFNYNAGTSVFNGLDRTGVDGFDVTFTGDASAPMFNSYELGLAIGNGGTMTVKAVDEGNTIKYIDFTKADSGNISNSGIDTNVEGAWSEVDGAIRFTPTTPNQIIIFTGNGNDFAIAAMTICTSDVPANVGSKQTPTITLASDALTAEIGTNATVNSPAVTTVPQNFKVRYKIDGDNPTGSTVNEETGVVTIGNTPGTITVQAFFSGKRFDGTNRDNNLFKAATPASYTLTITEVTPGITTFYVSDFNYAGQSNSKDQNLDRTIGGFSFTYTGGEAIKYNADNNFFFRGKKDDGTNYQGTLTIAPTDANNKITKIVIGSTTDVSAVTGFTVTADGNTIEPVLANGSITIDVPTGASSVVISTNELSASVNIGSYTINTTAQPSEEPCQPEFAFEHASLTAAKTGDVANALTTTPKNYPVIFNSSNTGVATIDAKGAVTPVAAGTTTITVSSTATEYFNAANASYTLTVVDDESVAGKTWDFTTWSTTDITTVVNDDSTWEYNDNGYHKNKTGTSQGKTDFGLAVMEGLLFTTTGSDQIRIYPNTDGQTDGSIRLQSKNAKIYMPELKAGQTITLTMMTASASSARGMVFSGAGADKVQLIYGAETSKTMNVVTYRVTEDISAEELIMSASTGGLYLYSIKLGYSELYWTDGSNTVTDVAVTTSGETSYTLNSATGASYTITDANGNESTDVEVVNGKVKVNTFTLGKTHTITATVDGHSATLTLRMVNTATISYDVTEAEGTLGFSFVEPVLKKNPEGLNVVKWKSSDPEVATVVAETGEVTFVSAGTTIITAYIEENNYYAYQKASYTLTVKEAEGVQEPWTLSLVVADGESVAVGSTGHKLTMTSDGTIKAGQVTTAIPGLTLSFGKTGDSDWIVAQNNDRFGGLYVADADPVTLPEESYIPTGGAYLGLEPTVNGVLSLHTAYYGLQSVVVVDKETNTVVASRRIGSSTSNAYENYEFTVPLQADRTYYVYNIGNGKEDAEFQKYDMPVNAITFTPVFLDRIGHVIVKNNEYNINGAQLADDIHDYPTFSNVHAEEGGSVHYHSYQTDGVTENTTIYLDEDGNLVIDGEGTAILEAHVSHTNTSGDACHSVAKCTVTYTKSQLKFSGSTFDVATNLVSEFEEPTLVLPEVLKGVDAEYSISAGSIDSETGNVTKLEGTTATVTATIADNLYYNPTANYIINILAAMVPFTVIEEITIPVGTRAFSLLRDNVYGGTTPAITLNDGTMYGNDKNLTWGSWIGSQDYQGSINKFFDNKNFSSTDVSVAKATGRMEIDALSEGTTTVTYTSRNYNGGAYEATPVVIKVNVVKDTNADYYEDVYNGSKATYRAWNFNQGFSAEELGRYNGSYTPLTNQSGDADNFITHLPDANAFWIYDEANNTLKSNTSITVTDNKIDRESVAFIANEPMNLLTPAVTSYNCFGKSSGKMESAREVGKEDTYDYNDGDEDVLTFFTFRTATDEWEDSNGDGKIQLNTVSDITFNTTTTLTPITGVGSGENATPYKAINLGGKAAAIRVNDMRSGMWMAVIADNTVVPEEPNVGRVQLASDGAIEQAVGQTLYDSYKDSKDADLKKYATNRVTNIFPYLKSAKGATTAAIEQEGAYGVTNIIVGYPAGMGTMNIGGGEKSPKINNIQRTYGYATFVSPYNIDLTGQTALKAYICDYYGRDNNIVHLVQIKHIPARTPVVLKGYARDRYILFMSEGNQAVEHGLSEEVFAKNRLVGAVDEPITVNPTEVGLAPDGSVTTWHHFGLTKNKFLAYTKAGTLAQGRAYMRLTQEEYEDLYASEVSASATSADAMKVIFEDIDFDYSVGDNTTTGIENVEKNTHFEGDGYYYTLNGVRVNGMPTQKGIYIHNGRKIVVR